MGSDTYLVLHRTSANEPAVKEALADGHKRVFADGNGLPPNPGCMGLNREFAPD
jgi:hypothetical protein